MEVKPNEFSLGWNQAVTRLALFSAGHKEEFFSSLLQLLEAAHSPLLVSPLHLQSSKEWLSLSQVSHYGHKVDFLPHCSTFKDCCDYTGFALLMQGNFLIFKISCLTTLISSSAIVAPYHVVKILIKTLTKSVL
jgi:hypothetical protein